MHILRSYYAIYFRSNRPTNGACFYGILDKFKRNLIKLATKVIRSGIQLDWRPESCSGLVVPNFLKHYFRMCKFDNERVTSFTKLWSSWDVEAIPTVLSCGIKNILAKVPLIRFFLEKDFLSRPQCWSLYDIFLIDSLIIHLAFR